MNTDDPLLPGVELVGQGMADLAEGRLTDYSLLVLVAAPRLKRLGIAVPDALSPRFPEHRLYERLEQRLGPGAHSYYNSLLRRIVSYSRALEREQSAAANCKNEATQKSRSLDAVRVTTPLVAKSIRHRLPRSRTNRSA